MHHVTRLLSFVIPACAANFCGKSCCNTCSGASGYENITLHLCRSVQSGVHRRCTLWRETSVWRWMPSTSTGARRICVAVPWCVAPAAGAAHPAGALLLLQRLGTPCSLHGPRSSGRATTVMRSPAPRHTVRLRPLCPRSQAGYAMLIAVLHGKYVAAQTLLGADACAASATWTACCSSSSRSATSMV